MTRPRRNPGFEVRVSIHGRAEDGSPRVSPVPRRPAAGTDLGTGRAGIGSRTPARAPRTNRGLLYGAIAIVAVIVVAIALSWAASRGTKVPSGPVASSVAGARIGAEVLDLSSGKTLLDSAGTRSSGGLAGQAAHRGRPVDRGYVGAAKPSPRVTRMLSYSDDQIADQLWLSGGRTAIITRSVAKLG